jgi:hypothetical protein
VVALSVRWILLGLAACGASPTGDVLRANTCLDEAALAFCDDFDLVEQVDAPFGFASIDADPGTTQVVVIASSGDRGLELVSTGATVARSPVRPTGSATHATVHALVELAPPPGTTQLLGMLLDSNELWLAVDASGAIVVDDLATTGTLAGDHFTDVAVTATWIPGGQSVTITAEAGALGDDRVMILEDTEVVIPPPTGVAVEAAGLSADVGERHVLFDDVTLDLGQ